MGSKRNGPSAFHSGRSGFTLFEMVISALLLGSVTAAVVPVLHWVQRERRHAARERLALHEAANVLEVFAARQFRGDLTENVLAEQKLTAAAQQQLTEGKLHVRATLEPGPPAAKRITVEVTWKPENGKKNAPVRLTAWFHDAEGTSP